MCFCLMALKICEFVQGVFAVVLVVVRWCDGSGGIAVVVAAMWLPWCVTISEWGTIESWRG